MPLQPDDNPAYWPLLLYEELYLLPHELAHVAAGHTSGPRQQDSPVPVAGESPVISAPTPTAGAQAQPDLLWGSMERGILILVSYADQKLMSRPDGLFLVDVLKALKLEFKEVATLNVCRCQSAADWEYVSQLPWKQLVSFGVQQPELPYTLETTLYEQKSWQGRHILPAESLGLIREDVARKKRLWNLLRQGLVL